VRLRQKEQLLHARHEASPERASRANRNEGLDDLKAVTERVTPRVPVRLQPALPVRRAHQHDIQPDHHHYGEHDDVAVGKPGNEHHHAHDHQQREGSTEVRLHEDQPNQADDDDRDGQQRVRHVADAVHPALEHQRHEQDGGDFGQL
jgi:hypothetical protein